MGVHRSVSQLRTADYCVSTVRSRHAVITSALRYAQRRARLARTRADTRVIACGVTPSGGALCLVNIGKLNANTTIVLASEHYTRTIGVASW